MRISLVEIISTLISASLSARNIREAYPGADWMPVPTILTLPSSSSATTSVAPTAFASSSTIGVAAARSLASSVNVRSVSRSTLAFWTIVSTEMWRSASGSKMLAAMPGRSGTPRSVTLAIRGSWAMPRTLLNCSMLTPPWISVPGSSLKLDATTIGTP